MTRQLQILSLTLMCLCVPPGHAGFFSRQRSPMEQFVTDNQYVPFLVIRDDWSVGTLISFPGQREQIEQFNKDCLRLTSEPDVPKADADIETTKAALSALSYSIDQDAGLELSLPKVVDPRLDLKGSFNDKRVSRIRVEFTNPREWSTSTGRVRARVEALARGRDDKSRQCAKDVNAPGNFILFRILSADAITYTFETNGGAAIKLDAQLLEKIGAGAEFSQKIQGQSSLTVNSRVLVGYRLYHVRVQGGFGNSKIDITEVAPKEIEKLRAAK